MVVTMLRSQSTTSETPLPYTASPWDLMLEDIRLVFRCYRYIPGILLPLSSENSNDLDELHPSLRNFVNVIFQASLSLVQILFLLSVPVLVVCQVPTLWTCVYIAGFVSANQALCNLVLNRKPSVLTSRYPSRQMPEHEQEHWVFINGIACGQTWMQKNIDRLGLTFGRKVTGVHNPSAGLVFDLLQCLIQRDFSYATQDVRDAYAIIRASLLDPKYTKVVLIAHSQGGIESGLIADWLLDELPQCLLRKLEIYTFGNAANHFNNPYRVLPRAQKDAANGEKPEDQKCSDKDHAILHIEHYANSGDFVARWGVLNFANIPNRFIGHVFVRQGSGHMMNQHYLGTMFPFGPGQKVRDSNPFVDSEIEVPTFGANVPKSPVRRVKIREISRLWLYRNGGSPEQ
ncbi:hypothetical protein BDV18DRAFT_119189 [Aspergillus unguis]